MDAKPEAPVVVSRGEMYLAAKAKILAFIAETKAKNPKAGEFQAKSVVFDDKAMVISFKKVAR